MQISTDDKITSAVSIGNSRFGSCDINVILFSMCQTIDRDIFENFILSTHLVFVTL